jgi:RNA polymerase sigma-70 factor (ECF subfamily)
VKGEDVFKKYSKQVYITALAYLKNHSDSEDVLQDVFVKYISSNKSFESEEHLKNWLLKVTVNCAKNKLRLPWRKKNAELSEELCDPCDKIGSRARELDVRNAVMSLSEKYRVVLILFYYDGLSIAKGASVLGISEEAFKLRLFRAREQSKNILGEDYENEAF